MNLEETNKSIEGVEGWLKPKEVAFLYNQARKLENKGVIVEIGSYKGRSTIVLAAGSEAGKSIKIYAIDPHMTDLEQKISNNSESSLDDFKRNIATAGMGHLVEPVVAFAQDAVKDWNRPIEFLWIDGDHSYDGAKSDFDLWAPFVVDGGVVAFHDSFEAPVQQVLKECIFTSAHYSDAGIEGSIAFGTKRFQPVSVFERIKNMFVFYLIATYRIFLSVKLPPWVKKPVYSLGKIILNAVKSDRVTA